MARIDQLKSMLKADPEDSFVQFAVAMEYKKMGDLDQAIDTFDALKSRDPDYVGLYFHLGKCHEECESFEKALEVYQEGINIANKLNDLHARSELMNEKMNLEIEL